MQYRFSSAHWRTRAETSRTLAEATTEERFQRLLLDMANEYEKLAENTEAQELTPQRDAAD